MNRLFERFLKEDQGNEKDTQIPLTKLPKNMREFVENQTHSLGQEHGRNISFGAYVRWLIFKESLNNTHENEIEKTKENPTGVHPPGTSGTSNRVRSNPESGESLP